MLLLTVQFLCKGGQILSHVCAYHTVLVLGNIQRMLIVTLILIYTILSNRLRLIHSVQRAHTLQHLCGPIAHEIIKGFGVRPHGGYHGNCCTCIVCSFG